MILGFDPGRDKCGVAIMTRQRQLLQHQLISSADAIDTIKHLLEQYPIELMVMGNLTTARQWQEQLNRVLPQLQIVMIDEHNSSLEARDRYWQMYQPQGLQKLIPQALRLPPRPVDDLVAIILIERYFHIYR